MRHGAGRRVFLLAASYFFYGWWDWRFCFLLALASLIAWGSGLTLRHSATDRARRVIVAVAVAVLLAILGAFKYYGFFLDSVQGALLALGWQRDLPLMQIILPVGISFFTFQAISYVVDVYRGEFVARRSPLDVMLYISFFPQLVAGPIVRAADFLPQLEAKPVLTRGAMALGFVLIAGGLFKKMVVANALAVQLVDPVFLSPSEQSSLVLMVALYGYAVQIYCDFSGYSDIAIGTAALLGYRFRRNFNQPYRALSIRDFWRRWHISLSTWLRDYLYVPLGGSRCGPLVTYRNLFLTMFLGGLWHGAAWTFVAWGTFHGLYLIAERLAGQDVIRPTGSLWQSVIRWVVTFHMVCFAWLLFRAENTGVVSDYLVGLAALSGGFGNVTWFALALIGASLALNVTPPLGEERLAARLAVVHWTVLAALFSLALIVVLLLSPEGTAPFIYFQF